MYKKRGESLTAAEALAKLRGTPISHTPAFYAVSDALRASKILNKLKEAKYA